MFLRFATVASVMLVVVFAVDPQCGAACTTNNQCTPSLECSKCHDGTCSAGLACGSPDCNVNTDCYQHGNCTACTQGVCTPNCGQPCETNKDCALYGCQQCVFDSQSNTSTCVRWQCGLFCEGDGGCDRGYAGCSFCDQRMSTQPGICKSGCGTACTGDSQCPRRCPFCTNSTCGLYPPMSEERF